MSIGTSSENGTPNVFNLSKEALQDTLNNIGNVDDKENVGIGGLRVTALTQEIVNRKQTLTTNPVEKGVLITDHIIKDPLLYSALIDVADTVIQLDQGLNAVNRRVLSALPDVTFFLPSRTATQATKISGLITKTNDQVQKINDFLNRGGNVFDTFSKSVQNEPLQKQVTEFFDYLYTSGQPIQIQTKHKLLDNMVLVSLPEERTDEFRTRFNLVFQQVAFAKTEVVGVSRYFKKAAGQAKTQVATKQNNGKQQGKQPEKSFAATLKNLIKTF